MQFNEFVQILQEKFEIQGCTRYESPVITDIRLMDKNENQWNMNVVYVGSLAMLNKQPHEPIMLLCVDDTIPLPEGSCYAHIYNEDLYELFNVAKDIIFEDLKGAGMIFELIHMALNGKNIMSVINNAAILLGNALVLVDSSQKVLAYSTNYEITDPLWAQNIETGYCSYEFIQKVRSNKQMQEWSKEGSESRIITLPGDLQPKLVSRITNEGHIVGAVIMIESHTPIRFIHFRQLPMIGKILFDVFNSHSSYDGLHGSYYSTVLYNLLDEMNTLDTIEHITTSKIGFPPEMFVIVARFVQQNDNRYLKRTFTMELEHIFPKGYSVQFKSYMSILVPSISEQQKEALKNLAEREGVGIGISWPFANIIEFKRHFNQAVISIKLAQHFGLFNQIFEYTQYYYYDLLNNYTGKIPLDEYCHPALQRLKEYDERNKTELYISLRTFIEHNQNLCLTAEALFIHRNTLVYRLRRIQQITNLDLKDIGILYSLMDAFRIDAFLNK